MANYEEKYEDELNKVAEEKENALNEVDKTYGDMIGSVDSYYDKQIKASEDWEKKQQQIQNEQTDFAIEQIEQQKAQAEKDYLKEQSGAYVDWQKQSAQHGVNAEKMAAAGMQGTGYSESSQVSMYNTYQNRVAVARESFNQATLNYNNAITQARMQNNAALAEIAYNAYQQQLQLSLEAFQYKNTIVSQMEAQKRQVESEYHSRWLDVQKLILQEKALEEEIRQFNETNGGGSDNGVYITDNMSTGDLITTKPNGKTRLPTGAERVQNIKDQQTPKSTSGKVDQDNINKAARDLGISSLSAETAYALVQMGILETYTKNGVTYFKKKSSYVSAPAGFVAGDKNVTAVDIKG
jgi:hypothetical protein